MKWWVKFLKLRRQNDIVKIMLLYVVIGICFLINSIYHGILLYCAVQSPIVYVMAGDTSAASIQELERLEDVETVSMQEETSVTIPILDTKLSFSCIYLSEEYLEEVYGISQIGMTKTFYANPAAYEQIMEKQSMENAPEGEKMRVAYTENFSDDASENRERIADAKLVPEIETKEPVLFCAGDGVLFQESSHVRVFARKHDFDHMMRARFWNAGFEIQNETELLQDEYEQELEMVRIRYGLLVAAVCFVGSGMVIKLAKTNKK